MSTAVLLLLSSPCLLQDLAWSVSGPADSRFGDAVALAGDADGDGLPDLVVGAPGDDTFGTDAGRAFLMSGLDGHVLHEWFGESALDEFGLDVDGGGDVDGDGLADVVVGAYRHDAAGTDAGRLYVFSGATGLLLHVFDGAAALDEFAVGVAIVGDVDGDGRADVAGGAHHSDENGSQSGSVRVFSGRTGATLFHFTGDEPFDDLGHVLSAAGDVDADGVPDVIAGLHDSPEHGQARVYSGADGAVLLQLDGSTNGDFFGHAVALAGDLDGDGHGDVLVGAALDDSTATNAGRALLVSGASGAVLHEWLGAAAHDQFGLDLESAGDFDGDGVADMAIAAPGDDSAGVNSGSVRVVPGGGGPPLASLQGLPQGSRKDVACARGADLDGDGRTELAVGFGYDDSAGVDAGIVRVWRGAEPTWTTVGAGLAGAAGVPWLAGQGLLAAGTPGQLQLTGAAPSASALLFLSPGSMPAAFKGGTLWAFPPLLLLPLATSPGGGLLLPWAAWPPGVPAGTPLVFQCAVADRGAPQGVSLSPAIQGLAK